MRAARELRNTGTFLHATVKSGHLAQRGLYLVLGKPDFKIEQVLAKEMNKSHKFRWKVAEPIQNTKGEISSVIMGVKVHSKL